jgi:hypothetical protein
MTSSTDLPNEIICQFYNHLNPNDQLRFAATSKTIRDCLPDWKCDHQRAFINCINQINLIEYTIVGNDGYEYTTIKSRLAIAHVSHRTSMSVRKQNDRIIVIETINLFSHWNKIYKSHGDVTSREYINVYSDSGADSIKQQIWNRRNVKGIHKFVSENVFGREMNVYCSTFKYISNISN